MDWRKTIGTAFLIVVVFGCGMALGQPRVIALDDIQKNDLIKECKNEKASLQEDFEKQSTAEVRELKAEVRELTKRNKDIIERNNELLETFKESNQAWQDLFEDFNASLYSIVSDVNTVMFDVNCWR